MPTDHTNDEKRADRIDGSILDRIGRTPLVRLRRMASPGGATVVVKCEQMNPVGPSRIGRRSR